MTDHTVQYASCVIINPHRPTATITELMTDIKCTDCGHIRETTERYPTLVACRECGSLNLDYTHD